MTLAKEQYFSVTLDPLEWGNNKNFVLYGTALITTANEFKADITVKDVHKNKLFPSPFQIPEEKGYKSIYIGSVTIPNKESFPITISGTINCSTKFDYVVAPQVALGLKDVGDKIIPVCYQSTLFCNDNADDPNRDMDYNDFVLTWQLYNGSTD